MRGRGRGANMAAVLTDHPSEYVARAVVALTPEGHRRVDELLDQLAEAVLVEPEVES